MARASVSSGSLRVSGLNELIRDLGKVQRSFRPEIRREIKGIAGIVSDEARAIAAAKGLEDSGALIRRTTPSARGAIGLVRSNASRGGFNYPAVYEYGRRGVGTHGPRAFVNPAVLKKQGEVVEAFGKLLDRLTSRAGLGKGGTL